MADPRLVSRVSQWKIFAQTDSDWSERQTALFSALEEIVASFGPFDQSAGPDGAHYIREQDNPFINEGLVCRNCVFYADSEEESGNPQWQCAIVAGGIEPGGLCKFWLIPEGAMSAVDDTARADAAVAARRKTKKKRRWSSY